MTREEYKERYAKRLVDCWEYLPSLAVESAEASSDMITRDGDLEDPEGDADTEATYE